MIRVDLTEDLEEFEDETKLETEKHDLLRNENTGEPDEDLIRRPGSPPRTSKMNLRQIQDDTSISYTDISDAQANEGGREFLSSEDQSSLGLDSNTLSSLDPATRKVVEQLQAKNLRMEQERQAMMEVFKKETSTLRNQLNALKKDDSSDSDSSKESKRNAPHSPTRNVRSMSQPGSRSPSRRSSMSRSDGLTDGNSDSGKGDLQLKVLVIGDSNVGKTSFIKRYAHRTFVDQYRATVGVDFALKVLTFGGEKIRLQLWDIAGQEQFGSMTRVYYKNAVGAFVVFDLAAEQPLRNIEAWKSDLDAKVKMADGGLIPTVLLGNKSDLEGAYRNCTLKDISQVCKELNFIGWFEVSAKAGSNVSESGLFLVQIILEKLRTMKSDKSTKGEPIVTGTVQLEAPSKSAPVDDRCCS
eukprot:m.29676 g.29676  ORF g.29676 m.29676 type:complete len:412 (-) comp8125_c0_seq1:17-1252(-)